ncbi:MAG: trypsin-like peptidase domain-containing protein [Ignavibacteriales bacterium]|nr:trypsin-like peptidase domain-containing protein [Ignavibacteriales bacterium]
MSTKSIITAVLLIGLGIVFGVVLVSSFKGVDVTLAQDPVQIGSQAKPPKVNPMLQALNEAYHTVARDVTPSVVYLTVKSSGSKGEESGSDRFFHFFGPEFRFEIPRRPEIGAGSGVILTSSGYILTNNHVVENADKDGIRVRLSDSREYSAKLIGTDRYTDLAVVKIDADNLPVPRLGNSDEVEVGHIVFAVGNPLGLTSTMTQGIVSALGRQIGIIDDQRTGYGIENFIQTDAAVNPGNSGGPLIDISGAVVGINTAIATTNQRYQGYSFAIPVNLAKKVAGDIIRFGDVRRGYIGVQIQTVDAVTAKAQGLDKARGVIIQSVNAGSAGEEAGLKPLDIILSVDGQEVNTSQQLQTVVAGKDPGQTIILKVFRDKKLIEKTVILKVREEERDLAATDTRRGRRDEAETAKSAAITVEELGLTVKAIDTRTKKDLGVDQGVMVEKVEPFSPAGQRNITPGDVILSVGNQEINSPDEFKESIGRMKAGDAVMLRIKGENQRVNYVAIQIPEKKAEAK